MAMELDHMREKLLKYAKLFKCDAVFKEGRLIIAEEITTRDHVLICDDVLIVSSMKKKGTFSFKKPVVRIVDVSLVDSISTNERSLCLSIVFRKRSNKTDTETIQIVCLDSSQHERISTGLQRIRARTLSHFPDAGSSVGTGRSESVETMDENKTGMSENDNFDDTIEDDSLAVDGLKVDAVFELMLATNVNSMCVKILKEIYDTEQRYVEDLGKLVSEYMIPLKNAQDTNGTPLLTTEDVQVLFVNIETILKVNEELLQSLRNGVIALGQLSDAPGVSEVAGIFSNAFVAVIPFFRMYSVYCHNYAAAIERLESLRSSNLEISHLLQKREMRKKNAQGSLQSLLIKPVQRICKYPLLFRELLKQMEKLAGESESEPDFMAHYEDLMKTAQTVESISASVNTKVNESESQEQVLRVYYELGGENGYKDLLIPSRRFVRTDDLYLREFPYADNKRFKIRLYVFNDLVIVATPLNAVATLGRHFTLKKANFKVLYAFELNRCGVKRLAADKDLHRFEIREITRAVSQTHRTSTLVQRVEVSTDSESLSESVMEDILNGIQKLEMNQEGRDEKRPSTKTRAWTNRKNSVSNWKSRVKSDADGSSQNLTDNAAATEESTSPGTGGTLPRPRSVTENVKDHFEKKFVVDPVVVPSDGDTLRIKVEFPAGALGIALETSLHPKGVLVATVANPGVAAQGGVSMCDRVVAVGDHLIRDTDTWEHVVQIIKTQPRPLVIEFERDAQTVAAGRARPGAGVVEYSRPANKSRQWAQDVKKSRVTSGTHRLVSLDDLKSRYQNGSSDMEKAEEAIEKLEVLKSMVSPHGPVLALANILDEFVSTEYRYVREIRALLGDFMAPISQKHLLKPEDAAIVFGNVETIFLTNGEFLNNVISHIVEWEDIGEEPAAVLCALAQVISEKFVNISPFFKNYFTYCYKYQGALATLVLFRERNQELQTFLKAAEAESQPLESLLIKPVQRICKYPLLLRSMLESINDVMCGAKDDPTVGMVTGALQSAEKLASDVNLKVREVEDMEKVLQIYNTLHGAVDLVVPHRRFVEQFKGSVVRAWKNNDAISMDIYLFNDILLLADGKQHIATIELQKCDAKFIGGSAHLTHVFRIRDKESRIKTSINKYRVTLETGEATEKFTKTVSNLIADVGSAHQSRGNQVQNHRSWNQKERIKSLDGIQSHYTPAE